MCRESPYAARPEAQEPYLILNWYRNQWWAGYEMGLTSDVETAGRYPEEFARRHAESSPYLRAVPLSDALRDGPPVEAPTWTHPVHRGEPKPIPPNVEIRMADSGRIEGPRNGWGQVVSAPRPDPTSLSQRTRRARLWMAEVMAEVDRCQALHRPFASLHEGLAIFEEEADELRHELRHGTPEGVRTEAIQAAAMLVRLLTDCGGEPPNGGGDDGE